MILLQVKFYEADERSGREIDISDILWKKKKWYIHCIRNEIKSHVTLFLT